MPPLSAPPVLGTIYAPAPTGIAVLDTTAINACLARAASGGAQPERSFIVQLLGGHYKITAPGIQHPGAVTLRGQGQGTSLDLANGANCNVVQTANFGVPGAIDNDLRLENLFINGNRTNQTITCPHVYVTASTALSATPTTLPVGAGSTTDFQADASGNYQLWVGVVRAVATGKTGASFTGVTTAAGDAFTSRKATWVTPFNGQGHGIAGQCARSGFRNVWVNSTVGSNVYLQGPSTAAYGYENRFEGVLRCSDAGRYNFEVGPGNSDGFIDNAVLGGGGDLGSLLIRSPNWDGAQLHPCGYFPTDPKVAPLAPAMITIACGETRLHSIYADMAQGTTIAADSSINNGTDINNCIIGALRTLRNSTVTTGHGIVFQGVSSNFKGWIVNGCNLDSPFGYAYTSGPAARTIGVQNTTAAKLQVSNALQFPPTSAIGSQLWCSTDHAIDYTGKQTTQTLSKAAAAIGDTTLTCYPPVGDGFDATGTIVVITQNPDGTFTNLRLTYTGITVNGDATITFTGIPAASTGSITTAIPINCGVNQHFLTGLSSGTLTGVANNTAVFVNNWKPTKITAAAKALVTKNWILARSNLNTSDVFPDDGGLDNDQQRAFRGLVTVANGATTGSVAHGIFGTPSRKSANCTSSPLAPQVTADGVNVTVTLAAAAVGAQTFDVAAFA